FERIARWFIGEEIVRRAEIAESVSETTGSLVIPAPGGPFTVTAKADRIDRLAAGGLVIIDYKTGSVPQKTEIENAVAVQLPLEGLIARDGRDGEPSQRPPRPMDDPGAGQARPGAGRADRPLSGRIRHRARPPAVRPCARHAGRRQDRDDPRVLPVALAPVPARSRGAAR